jgi:hypothetical protein
MEIIIGIVVIIVTLIALEKLKGPPQPDGMSDESIAGRLQSEQAWINRYMALPYENRMGEGIRKQYEEKKLYVMELTLELAKRHAGNEPSLIPVLQRTLELVRGGLDEEKAKEQALAEFVAKRDRTTS